MIVAKFNIEIGIIVILIQKAEEDRKRTSNFLFWGDSHFLN